MTKKIIGIGIVFLLFCASYNAVCATETDKISLLCNPFIPSQTSMDEEYQSGLLGIVNDQAAYALACEPIYVDDTIVDT